MKYILAIILLLCSTAYAKETYKKTDDNTITISEPKTSTVVVQKTYEQLIAERDETVALFSRECELRNKTTANFQAQIDLLNGRIVEAEKIGITYKPAPPDPEPEPEILPEE